MDALDVASLVLLYGFVITAVAMDFDRMKISNRLIVAGLVVSLFLRIGQGGVLEFIPYLWNISFPVIMLYLFYLIGVLGAGDIKLFSVIGGFVNFRELVMCMVTAFLVGAVISLIKMLVCGKWKAQLYAGGVYLLSLLLGKYQPYERNPEDQTNQIHFSLSILIGLCISAIFPLFG